MVKHATAKKRRSGNKVKINPKRSLRVKIENRIINHEVRAKYDTNKSPYDNLTALGLVADVNVLPQMKMKLSEESKPSGVCLIEYADKMTLEALRSNEMKSNRKVLTEAEERYAKLNIDKHGDNYEKMFKDLSTNYNQFTLNKLTKLCKSYISFRGNS
eukprot:gene15759-21340_t